MTVSPLTHFIVRMGAANYYYYQIIKLNGYLQKPDITVIVYAGGCFFFFSFTVV